MAYTKAVLPFAEELSYAGAQDGSVAVSVLGAEAVCGTQGHRRRLRSG